MISIFRFVIVSSYRSLNRILNTKNLFIGYLRGVMSSPLDFFWKAPQERIQSYTMPRNQKYSTNNNQSASTSGSAGQQGNRRGREEFEFFFGPKNTFSQMHPAAFVIDGEQFTCMEQYMQWKKAVEFGDYGTAAEIMTTSDPKQHKKLGRQVKPFDPKWWGQMSVNVVKYGNIHKYRQNPKMKAALFATHPKTLVETSPRDCLWGIGLGKDNPKARDRSTWRGKNLLGQTLTEVRNILMEEEGLILSSATSVSSQHSFSVESSRESNSNRKGDNRSVPPSASKHQGHDSGLSSHFSSKDKKPSPSKSEHRHSSHHGSGKHHHSSASDSRDKSSSQSRDKHGHKSHDRSKGQHDSSTNTSKDKNSQSRGEHRDKPDRRPKEQGDHSNSTSTDKSSSLSKGGHGHRSDYRSKEHINSSSNSRERSDLKKEEKDDKKNGKEGKGDKRPTDTRDQSKQIEKHSSESSSQHSSEMYLKFGVKRKREDETKERHEEKTNVSECTPEKRPKYESVQTDGGQKQKKISFRLSLAAGGEEQAVNKERAVENQPVSFSTDVTSEEKSSEADRDV